MEFCKAFNARTQDKQGLIIPVVITVYVDHSFTFITKNTSGSCIAEKKRLDWRKVLENPTRKKLAK